MAVIQSQKVCRHCQAPRLFLKPATNHILHLFVSLFLCGLWVPIWILDGLCHSLSRPRCSVCGGK